MSNDKMDVSWEAMQNLQEKQAAITPKQVPFDEAEDTMGLVMQIKFNYEHELQELLGEAQDRLGEKVSKHIREIETGLECVCELLTSSVSEDDLKRVFEAKRKRP